MLGSDVGLQGAITVCRAVSVCIAMVCDYRGVLGLQVDAAVCTGLQGGADSGAGLKGGAGSVHRHRQDYRVVLFQLSGRVSSYI